MGVAKSHTQLSDTTQHKYLFRLLLKSSELSAIFFFIEILSVYNIMLVLGVQCNILYMFIL